MDEKTDIGPQAAPDLMAELHEQVVASVEAGATVRTGGKLLNREGAYYPPTVLTNIPDGCPVDTEETFGPIATVYKVSDEEEAIDLANDTHFGLGASLWTADRERGQRLARNIEAGCVYINQLTKSDPRVPFGGIEDSGYGHELSVFGISPTAVRALQEYGDEWVEQHDLSSLRLLGSTGEPWDAESWQWFYETVGGSKRPIINISGGTEIMGRFLMPMPTQPLKPCSLGGPGLGMDIDIVTAKVSRSPIPMNEAFSSPVIPVRA
jgi:hypothetical protein